MSETFRIGQTYFPKHPIVTQEKKNSIPNQGPSFKDVLTQQIQPQQKELKFSAHAMQRLDSRGIELASNEIQQLNQAVEKAAKKGSKDSMILINDLVFIVNVPNRVVVTAMDKDSMKEHVFTQIDSAIIL
ncbi:TIGR02530 family flagellar biosynthesis protein [Tepidibacillus fermentans]|uniref:Flagellar operon protein n=1 Tax=Tepidibacillus fermentans TaxID=1281767 RepID=A0A4V2USW1_9BACI|nr:TIGR02530 family flagellar biosynthesis protein [Tepidibacillus fermentans]TCS82943.1 flagellar operon protein [Tepidibacillus fermentans]